MYEKAIDLGGLAVVTGAQVVLAGHLQFDLRSVG